MKIFYFFKKKLNIAALPSLVADEAAVLPSLAADKAAVVASVVVAD